MWMVLKAGKSNHMVPASDWFLVSYYFMSWYQQDKQECIGVKHQATLPWDNSAVEVAKPAMLNKDSLTLLTQRKT